MKRSRSLALVCAGPAANSSLLKIPGVLDHLGPVKGLSLRVASRVVNTLRAGWPAEFFEDLADSRVVVVSVPEQQVPETVRAMAASHLAWKRRCVLFADGGLNPHQAAELQRRGALVGTVAVVKAGARWQILVEGDSGAMAALKQLVPARTPIVPLKPGGTVLYRAGAASSGCLLVALLTAASDLFRAAGISAPDSAKLALAMAEETVRGFGKSGRKQWIPPSVAAPVQDHAAVRFYRDVLRGAEQYLLLQKATGQGSR